MPCGSWRARTSGTARCIDMIVKTGTPNANVQAPDEAASAPKPEIICGWRELVAEVRRSRAQLWRDVRKGLFPAPIELGQNSVGWHRTEVEAWKQSRPRRTYRAKSETDTSSQMNVAVDFALTANRARAHRRRRHPPRDQCRRQTPSRPADR
jgi:predicted DNA-binding transcriptional regulator AlpA